MIQISMITTTGGYLKDVLPEDFFLPRVIGMFTLVVGLFSLAVIISLLGWTKSKKIGRFTTFVGVVALLRIFMTMIRINF